MINSLFYAKTQNLCLFASLVFLSHNLKMEKSEITHDTTRVSTCFITNTILWEIESGSTGLLVQLAPYYVRIHAYLHRPLQNLIIIQIGFNFQNVLIFPVTFAVNDVIIQGCGKFSSMKPPPPSVGASQELDGGFLTNWIYWHPDGTVLKADEQ